MRSMSFRSNRFLVVTLALLMGLALVAADALAAPGGKGKGKGKNNGGDAEVNQGLLTVGPDPCATPGEYTVNGSGFHTGYTVKVYLKKNCDNGIVYGFDWIWAQQADGSGKIDFSTTTQSCTGVYELRAVQPMINADDVEATATFQVE